MSESVGDTEAAIECSEKYGDDEEGDDGEMAAVDKGSDGVYFHSAEQTSPGAIRQRHTKFLDLTNGEGGEHVSVSHTYHYDEDDDMMADTPPEGGLDPDPDDGPHREPGRTLSGMRIDPNTPGKVVEAGQEHTGRWTKEEHEAFLNALHMYGKEWKKVAAKVKTRTVVQTRTHAQKYFQKLQKVMEQDGGKTEITHVDMGVAPEAKKVATSIKKKRTIQPGAPPVPAPGAAPGLAPGPGPASGPGAGIAIGPGSGAGVVIPPSIAAKSRQTSVTSAAHLISNLSSVQSIPTNSQTSAGSSFTGTTPGPPVLSRPQPPPQQQQQHHPQQQSYPPRHGFSTGSESFHPSTTNTSSSSAYSNSYMTNTTSSMPRDTGGGGGWGGVGGSGKTHLSSIKIVAPDPNLTRGKFPEPSPAACGKRKLAEIAAARMLAGVAAIGGGDRVVSKGSGIGLGTMAVSSSSSSSSKPLLSSAMMDDADGTATPPPGSPRERTRRMPSPIMSGAMRANETPVSRFNKPLQIVNPETLGVTCEQKRRKRGGGESPVTPWDSQLETLVSETVKNKAVEETEGLPFLADLNEEGNGSYDDSFPHRICGPGSAYGRIPLHKAVCSMDIESLRRELSMVSNEQVLLRKDEAGFCPIHSACALRMLQNHRHQQVNGNSSVLTSTPTLPSEIVRLLITAGADPCCVDDDGNTPLHWAARAGDKHVAEILLLKNCPPDSKNNRAETPLHWAMRAGRVGFDVVAVLLKSGSRPSTLNHDFKRPIDVAAEGFDNESTTKSSLETSLTKRQPVVAQRKRLSKEQKKALQEAAEEKRVVRAHLLKLSAQSRTLVLHHPECLEHIPKSESDWETPDRITSILKRLDPSLATPSEGEKPEKTNNKTDSASNGSSVETTEVAETTSDIFPYEITMSTEFEKAKLEILRRVHSTEYLSFVNGLSKDLERQQKEAANSDDNENKEGDDTQKGKTGIKSNSQPVVPFTPMVQRTMIKIDESKVKLGNHSDTSFSVGSLRAARRAAGAVQYAVDCVLVGRNRNAFCVVRPPGHHAGINGLLEGGESCGFCIFNNVAAGALHAVSDERLLCDRCAIVDIDIHHGNGTEEIVKRCHDPGKLFFFSIHLYDNEASKKKRPPNSFPYKFYPGTGAEDDVAFNIINVPIIPLWKEDRTSNQPVTNTHNTRQRTKQQSKQSASHAHENSRKKTKDVIADETTPDVVNVNSLSKDSNSSKVSDVESDAAASQSSATAREHKRSPVASPRNHDPTTPSMSGRIAYRQAIQNRLLPALRAFNPDLILISAGFDASRGDVGNARHEAGGKERMGIDLDPEDYAWTTRRILEIGDICCQGRVVSVLEGGYGKTPASGSAKDALDRTIFSECAVRHLHAMIDPYDAESRFSS